MRSLAGRGHAGSHYVFTHMSEGSATSMYLIFMRRGKSISSFTSQSLRTSTDESLGFSWACNRMCNNWEQLISHNDTEHQSTSVHKGTINPSWISYKWAASLPVTSGPTSDALQTASGISSAGACDLFLSAWHSSGESAGWTAWDSCGPYPCVGSSVNTQRQKWDFSVL